MANQPSTKPAQRSEKFIRYAMDTHGRSVYLVALSQTRSIHDAQDVAQDIFMRLLSSTVRFRDDEHLRAWLLHVTVNRCRELYRMPWRRRVDSMDAIDAELASGAPDPADEAVAALEQSPVWQAVRQLPAKLRVVAILHYVEEYPTERIAQIVGCTPATVRTRLHRARKQMRKILDPETEDDHAQAGIRQVSLAHQRR